MGLGLNNGGLSVAEWLCSHGAQVTVTDLKPARALKSSLDKLKQVLGAQNIKYTLGRHDFKDFTNQDVVIKNPGVANDSPYLALAKKYGAQIINEARLFFSIFPGPIVGVTGTRGKSTTSTLLHQILKTKFRKNVLAGNIATQGMMAVVDKLAKNSYPILELSSWQLESLAEYKISPHIAVVTNVLVDHLNRHRSFNEYKTAKLAIVKNQKSRDIAVLNFDNKPARNFAKDISSRVYFFSLTKKVKGSFIKNNAVYFNNGKKTELVMTLEKIKIPGEHNRANILAAITVAKVLGLNSKHISQVVNKFKGLKYRLQYLGQRGGVKVYNDATSTTPDATLAALRTLVTHSLVLIAGGMDKKLDYRALARQIKKQVDFLVLLDGTGSKNLLRQLRRLSFPSDQMKMNIKNLKSAWQIAWSRAEKQGGTILFSPAATSFNMFINEFDRARQLEKLFYGQKTQK